MSDGSRQTAAKLEGPEKLAVEMGPLLLFFAGLFFHPRIAPLVDTAFQTDYFNRPGRELYLGLALFCPAFAVAFGYSIWRTRRAAPMLIVVAVITAITATFTFLFENKQFTYMKPTFIYGIMAATLGGGLLAGRNFLKIVFDGALEMPEKAWRTLTWRFVGFNLLAALANEIAWRTLTADCVADMPCSGEKTWFAIKAFGFTAAYIGFVLANTPFIMKHMIDKSPSEGGNGETEPPSHD
ncbi:MAG: inner membrane-spanning protein YciB [Parvularcula sp.]